MTVHKPEFEITTHMAALEALAERLEAVFLDLRNTQLDLEDVNDDLASTQEEFQDTRTRLDETELRLQNTQDAPAAANRERVIPRPVSNQDAFAVLKFRRPQPLPAGAFHLFAQQRKSVQTTLDQFIHNNPDLNAVEVEELRFDRSPRGQYVIQHGHTEDEMKTFILSVFNTHTRE